MKNSPSKQRRPQEQHPFHIEVATGVFPPEELLALTERGHMMAALAAGTVAATTAEHKHFLQVDREEVEPATVAERAWVRLKGRREYEREQQSAPLPPQPEDYGIIEWEKEKCWW